MKNKIKRKIKILGAGLSGLTAAINLVKNGYQVEIYEKNKDVGKRFHGDLQGLENWSEKKDVLEDLKHMNIEINFENYPFSDITVTDCQKMSNITVKKPMFYLVKRGSFSGSIDDGLKKQALKQGVKIFFNKLISEKEADIIATGPDFKKIPGVVKGIVFKTNHKNIAVNILNDELAYKGYAYLLIANGYGCMCSVAIDELNRINGCFEKTKKFLEKKFNLNMKNIKEVGGVGSFSFQSRFKKNDRLYVGEAAGLQDFVWGFGMRYAITSGYLAAQSIIKDEDYEKIAKKRFKNKLKAGIVNRYLWEKYAVKNYSFFVKNSKNMMDKLYAACNYSVLQKILYPLALHHLKKKYPQLK